MSLDLKEPLRSLSASAAATAVVVVVGGGGRCSRSREKSGLSSPVGWVSVSLKSLLLGVAEGEGRGGG